MTTEVNNIPTEENVQQGINYPRPVFYVPVLDQKLRNIIKLETEIHKIEDDKKVVRLETELEELRQKAVLTNQDYGKDFTAMRRKIKNARLANANRLNKTFVYKVANNKKSAHASAAASCAKKFLNTMVRMCAKCDRVRYQLFDLDNITKEAFQLELLPRHIETNMFGSLANFDNAFQIFFECNKCQNMDQFESFCQENGLNDEQRKFFLTTKYQQKLQLAERKKSNASRQHPPLIVPEEDDDKIIIKYFTPKLKIYFKLEEEYLDSINIDIQRRDEKTNEILKTLSYKLDACFREVRNKDFQVYGSTGEIFADNLEKIKMKQVPCWMQNVKISSVKNMNKLKKNISLITHDLPSEIENSLLIEEIENSSQESESESGSESDQESKLKKQKISQTACTSNDQ
jgi:hypothetical protein